MIRLIFCLLMVLGLQFAHSQSVSPELHADYRAAKTDQDKGNALFHYFIGLSVVDNHTTYQTLSLLAWFRKQKDEVGLDYTNLWLAKILMGKGDYPGSLNLIFSVLQAVLSRAYNGIGCIYGEGGLPDSGMVYAQKAVTLDAAMKNDQQLALSISTLGENYIAAGEYDIALPFLALLIVFEFFNLLLHPFLENITNHSPILMLLALVLIAALLVPLHHRLEKWATHTLVEKNKTIRLAEAKRTIEKLEKKESA